MAKGLKLAPWRREPDAAPGSDLSEVTELDLIDVTLETEYRGEPAAVDGLGLGFDASGLTVRKPGGTAVASIPWPSIVGVTADVVGTQQHSWAAAVSLEVESSSRRHRFLVPNVQREALTDSLGVISSRYARRDVVAQPRGRRH